MIMKWMRSISLGVALIVSTCTASAPVYALDPRLPIPAETIRLPLPSEEEINTYFNWKDPTWSLGGFVMSGILLAFPDGLTNFNPYMDGPAGIRVLISTAERDSHGCIGALIEVESLEPGKATPMGYDHKELLIKYCDTKKVEL